MENKENIKIIVSDFDGIFTDGKIEIFSDGKTSKRLDYRDLLGVFLILKKGIKFVIISGDSSNAIDLIKQKFPQIEVFQNERNKIEVLKNILSKYSITPDSVVYLGDDINDEECLKFVKYPVTVPFAHKKIKEIPGIYITENNGGSGAFREVADLLL